VLAPPAPTFGSFTRWPPVQLRKAAASVIANPAAIGRQGAAGAQETADHSDPAGSIPAPPGVACEGNVASGVAPLRSIRLPCRCRPTTSCTAKAITHPLRRASELSSRPSSATRSKWTPRWDGPDNMRFRAGSQPGCPCSRSAAKGCRGWANPWERGNHLITIKSATSTRSAA